MYDVPLIDYGRGAGTLVSSGCGIMMAVMGQTSLRYCVDIDRMKSQERLGDFMLMAEQHSPPLAVCGWFSLTEPRPLREAIAALRTQPITYGGGGVHLSDDQTPSLGDFIARIRVATLLFCDS